MKHSEAILYLSEFVEDSLPPATRVAAEAHVAGCSDCRQWCDTYCELRAMPVEVFCQERHQPGATLALFAVRPEEQYEPDRAEAAAHVGDCHRCRQELGVLENALRHARPPAQRALESRREGEASRAGRLRHRAQVVRFAAGLLVALVTGFLVGSVFEGRLPGLPSRVHLAQGSDTGMAHRIERLQVTDSVLRGRHLIDGGTGLDVSRLKVDSGAAVTFRAAGRVSFGDGFQIGENTRVTVETRHTEGSEEASTARAEGRPPAEERTSGKRPAT